MTLKQTKKLLDSMPLTTALWWFIENSNEDDKHRNELFFYLRERVRNQDPQVEFAHAVAFAKRA